MNLTQEAREAVLQLKYARIIEAIAAEADIDAEEAMRVFYGSETMPLIQEGVGDLHCRSDLYLAHEVLGEGSALEPAARCSLGGK